MNCEECDDTGWVRIAILFFDRHWRRLPVVARCRDCYVRRLEQKSSNTAR